MHRRRLPGQQPHPAKGVEQFGPIDGEGVGMRVRDQATVVGEIALDQAGDEANIADGEAGFALAEAQLDRLALAEDAVQLTKGP